MNSILKSPSARFTVADCMNWPEAGRWELIGGVAYDMSPAPTIRHQTITGGFYSMLREKLKGKTCQPFIAPVDVVFDPVQAWVQRFVWVDGSYGAGEIIDPLEYLALGFMRGVLALGEVFGILNN
jgi:hypothetical protein